MSGAAPPMLVPRVRSLEIGGEITEIALDAPGAVRVHQGHGLGRGEYRVEIGRGAANIEACDDEGVRSARATLAQLGRQYGERVPALRIDDGPAFAVRGLMLDVSRDRVPTMEHLFELVDTMAALKMNHLQLYTEHTFAYAGHEDVWRGWSPMTADQVRALDVHCRARGVELAANQNCFGHLASWLRHPAYAHLAETHGDWMFDVWARSGPFSLCPTDPKSLALVEEMLGQLLPCFTSGLVNIGCDETYDIAYGRSRAEVERRGRAAVYLEFVAKIAEVCTRHGKRPMFWGDIALSHPACIKDIPRELISLAWGYEPDAPFDRWCELLAGAGRDVWVCPGTSTWRSITGRSSERRGNLERAAIAGARGGATGFLACEWGDMGHRQQWPITLHALAHAADAAWRGERAAGYDARAGAMHVLGDASGAAGEWLERFGDADLALRRTCGRLSRPDLAHLRNQTAIFIDMHTPLERHADVGAVEDWERVCGELERLGDHRPARLGALIDAEILHAWRGAMFAARRGLQRRAPGGIGPPERKRLAGELEALIEEHARLWRLRSREGGLDRSLSHDRACLAELEGSAP